MHTVVQLWLMTSIMTVIANKWFIKDEDNRMFVMAGWFVMCFAIGFGYAITHYE